MVIRKDGFNATRFCLMFAISSSVMFIIMNCAMIQSKNAEKTMYAAFKEYTILMDTSIDYAKTIKDPVEKEKLKNKLIEINDHVYKIYVEARVDSAKIIECMTTLSTSIQLLKETF